MDFYLAAAHKSSGKTTISIGLSAAFKHLNYRTLTFKKGPDYIDPLWLQYASHNPCFNLDFYTMNNEEIVKQFQQDTADIKFVEGNKGLYDGLDKNGVDSNAALANLLNIPVVLVIDCIGITRGIAPLLLGYQQFNAPKTNIVGVILNKVKGARHQQKLINAVEYYTDIPLIGSVFHNKDIIIDERHLGLIPSNELVQTELLINKIKNVILSSIEIDFFKKNITNNVIDSSKIPIVLKNKTKPFNLTIAVAKDAAFGFYYANDLKKFEQLGAKIIFFSPLNDTKLPSNIDGLFLGGGFPEIQAKQLADNILLLQDLHKQIANGLPTYAECGGLMILSNSIIYKNQTHTMAQIIDADCLMSQNPIGKGYVNITPTNHHPWGFETKPIKAHEFHYSTLINIKSCEFVYKVNRGNGIINKQDGIVIYNLLANYTHLKDSKSCPWIEYFLYFCDKI